MKSSTILAYSMDFINSYDDIYPNSSMPSLLREIPEFAKCIYFLERHPNQKELIFKTEFIENWNRSKESINSMLEVLIGNEDPLYEPISIIFKEKSNINEVIKPEFQRKEDYHANILFSGGADSICGSYHYSNKLNHNIVYTHIYHRNTPRLEMIKNHILKDLAMPLYIIEGRFKGQANFRALAGNKKETEWNLSQSRTLLYLSNAIPINYFYGIRNIFITENGPLTLNPPYSENSSFTNTTNPEFIDFFNQFINKYFGEDLIKVSLPFRNYTKSELLASVPPEILEKTHSCSRSPGTFSSCCNCQACFLRLFSSYAFNYEDNIYKPGKEEFFRYEDKSIFEQTDLSFFKKDTESQKLLDFIDFCGDMISGIVKSYSIKYSKLTSKVTVLSLGIKKYYDDIWDLLLRYSKNMFAGIFNFFERNRNYKNERFVVYKSFLDVLNKLYTSEEIGDDFFSNQENQIRIVSRSIAGSLS